MNFAERQKFGKAFCFGSAPLQKCMLQLQIVEFLKKSVIFLAQITQGDVTVPSATYAVAKPNHAATKRCDGFYNPDADKRYLLLAFYLEREQQQLCRENNGQQHQGAMT
jgi:hypothetical protein